MAVWLNGSVGKKGDNDKYDVMAVQHLLNKFIMPGCMQPFKPLVCDGDCGKLTKGAIVWFQLNIMGNPFPDGRVDKKGKTIDALNGPLKWPSGPPKPPPPEPEQKPTQGKYDPVRIHDGSKYDKVLRSPDSVATSWALFPWLKPGQIWPTGTHDRIILTARHDGVIFILDSKNHEAGLYRQEVKGFINDVALLSLAHMALRARGLQTLARLEVIFLAGLACGASSWVLAGSLSLSAVEFVAEHKKQIPKWTDAMVKLLAARAILKQYAPTLWSVIEDQLFDTTIKAFAEATIYNKDFIAQSIGVAVGAVGQKAYTRKISVASILFTTLAYVCGRAISGALATIKYLPAQMEADAKQLFLDLQAGAFHVSQEKALKIVQEVAANPDPINQTLKDLKVAFEDIAE